MSSDDRKLKGLVGAPVTAFTPDNDIDTDTLQKLMNFLVNERVDTIALLMHIGENAKLGEAEHRKVVEASVEAIAGRVPTYVHVSAPGTDLSVRLTEHANGVGADGVILLAPYLWKPDADAILEHFQAVDAAVDGWLVGYNNFGHTGVNITPDMLVTLLRTCPNMVALKDASFHMRTFTEFCRLGRSVREDFAAVTGIEYIGPAASVGGRGTFSAIGAVAPRLARELTDLALAGDLAAALPLQYRASELLGVLYKQAYPASIKAAMEIMGRPTGPGRRPEQRLTPEEYKQLEADLDALGVLDDEPHGW